MDLHLRHSTEEGNYKQGLLATSDSFYNTQCRQDPKFEDWNEGLYEAILEKHPDTDAIQMENYAVYALSRMARNEDVYAASASIILVNMFENEKVLGAPK